MKNVWFNLTLYKSKHGVIKRWLYDTWYEIEEDVTGKLFWVLPNQIRK